MTTSPLTKDMLENINYTQFPVVVRKEIHQFIRKNRNLLENLDPQNLRDLLAAVKDGRELDVQVELYRAMTPRERMNFMRLTADRMDTAVSARIRLLALLSNIIQILTDMALNALDVWLDGLIPEEA